MILVLRILDRGKIESTYSVVRTTEIGTRFGGKNE